MNELSKYPKDATIKIGFSYDCGYAWGCGRDLTVSMDSGDEVLIESEDMY